MGITARNPKPMKNGNSHTRHHETSEKLPKTEDETLKKLDCDISAAEGVLMISLWSMCLAYIAYCIYLDSKTISDAEVGPRFLPGWKFTNRLKDFSNYEWEFWRDFWTQSIWPVMIGHILLNLILSSSSNQVKLVVNTVYSFLAVCWVVNWKILICLLVYVTYGYFLAWTGVTALIWSSAILVFGVIAGGWGDVWISSIAGDDAIYPRKGALMIFGMAMVTLRLVSFGLDWKEHVTSVSNDTDNKDTDKKTHHSKKAKYDKSEEQENSVCYDFACFLHYCFYVPLFFTGPMFNYNQFEKEYWNPSKRWTRESFKTFVIYGLRVAISYFLCELMLHYLYFNAIYHSLETMESISLWTLAGIGYYHGQFFMVKYVVLFGLPRFLAMTDHLDVPTTPSCIGRIGTSIPIWRTFDRGLYIFMTKYIYVPIGGGHLGVLRKVLGSALCFTFVFLWHGATYAVFLWVFVNFLDISMEAVAGSINKLPAVQQFQAQYFSKAFTRRVKSLLRAPCKLFTTIGVNTFFADNEKIWAIYVKRLVFEGFPTSFFLCVFFFFCLGQSDHFITALEKRRSRNTGQKCKKQ